MRERGARGQGDLRFWDATAEFFSFGTNDLTQTCLGMSRDDSGSFLPPYAELEISKTNPLASNSLKHKRSHRGHLEELLPAQTHAGSAAAALTGCGLHADFTFF